MTTTNIYSQAQLAEFHLIAGLLAQILKDNPVAPGHHKARKCRQVIFTMPDDSSVDRDPGRGDGYTEESVTVKLNERAMLLFIDRLQHNPVTSKEESVELWRKCRIDAERLEVEPPAEALEAMALLTEERKDERVEVKTPAKRSGEKRIKVSYGKVAAKAHKAPKRKLQAA